MRRIIRIVVALPALIVSLDGQTPGKAEFEVASIKMNAPQPGFHFASETVSGGPGTPDPGMFRCSKCTLATLIVKAFRLQPYQFPGRTSLTDTTYDVMATIPAGASEEDFSVMLQNLLKERFGLAWHFQEKTMKGFHLVVAKNGPKLNEAGGATPSSGADSHGYGQGGSHNHSGVIAFGSTAAFRSSNQSMADLARVLSDQTGVPVDDETGLKGKYDISLRWSGSSAAPHGGHGGNVFAGGGEHGGHDGGGVRSATADDLSGPTLFDALQQQLGLKLVPAQQATARLFVVDKVSQRPTEN